MTSVCLWVGAGVWLQYSLACSKKFTRNKFILCLVYLRGIALLSWSHMTQQHHSHRVIFLNQGKSRPCCCVTQNQFQPETYTNIKSKRLLATVHPSHLFLSNMIAVMCMFSRVLPEPPRHYQCGEPRSTFNSCTTATLFHCCILKEKIDGNKK